MITKKCHKLQNTLKEENEKNDEDDNNDQKEILIVDVNNNLEESEEEKEGDEQIENSINDSKYRLSKPKPILNVDTNSINFTDYQVNDNKNSYNNYPNPRYNFYTGRGSSYYIPKSYSFYRNSNSNNGLKNDSIINNHFNNLASNKDYSYNYKNNNIPYKLNRNNSYIGYNISRNNNNDYPYANNTDNHSLTYSFYLQQKPNNGRSSSYIKSQNNFNFNDDENRYNLKNSNSNNYLSISQRIKPNKYKIDTQNIYYPTKERVTYVLNNYKNNIGSTVNNKNNTYRASNKSIPYNLNYNYLFN